MPLITSRKKPSGTIPRLYEYVTNATALLCFLLRLRAGTFSWKRCSAAIAWMRSRVSAPISGLSLSARETVDFDTPAIRAMSAMVLTGLLVMQPVAKLSEPLGGALPDRRRRGDRRERRADRADGRGERDHLVEQAGGDHGAGDEGVDAADEGSRHLAPALGRHESVQLVLRPEHHETVAGSGEHGAHDESSQRRERRCEQERDEPGAEHRQARRLRGAHGKPPPLRADLRGARSGA